MAFVGSINNLTRSLIAESAPHWQGLPVYVACSGNFTVERILASLDFTEIHSCDVSLYSSLLGAVLSGQDIPVSIKREDFAWLEDYLSTPMDRLATVAVCMEMLKFAGRTEPYFVRMLEAYREQFPALHKSTLDRFAERLDGMAVASYFPGDVMDYLRDADKESVVISFPPTYKGGYENLYKKVDATFAWNEPHYVVFNDERFAAFLDEVKTHRYWMTLKDGPVPELAQYEKAIVQTGARSRPVHVFTNTPIEPRLGTFHQKVELLNTPRLSGSIQAPITFAKISQAQMNGLRAQYLNPGIVPAPASVNVGLFAGGELFGAVAFSPSTFNLADLYQMTDFPIRPVIYKRLSKLVLTAILSHEFQIFLQRHFGRKVRTVITTAFSEKAASMKYRGIYEPHSKSEGKLNYIGRLGRWPMEEGLQWWIKKHGQTWKP